MKRNELLEKLEVSRLCTESWEAMTGDARERHCELCDKEVHNLAVMSPRAIEDLIFKTQGRFCARVTRREDRSLVTLERVGGRREKAPLAASVAASALIAMSVSSAAAQTSAEGEQNPQAVLTGTVLKPDGSGPAANAQIILTTDSSVTATTTTDDKGAFRLSAVPGLYTLAIRQNPIVGRRILAVTLHEGLQILQPTRTHVGEMVGSMGEQVLLGEMSGTISYSFHGALRHPWSYLKYLVRKL